MNNFPQNTQFIGLSIGDGWDSQEVVLFEGHHRAAAIALANVIGNPIKFVSNPAIVITNFDLDDEVHLVQLLNLGSNNPNS